MILEPSDLVAAFVLSVNETFDWHISEGNYCQIIFLTSKSNPKALADAILWFNHLVELVTDRRNNKDQQLELPCNVRYTLNIKIELFYLFRWFFNEIIPFNSVFNKLKMLCRSYLMVNQKIRIFS
jgi:hypothetical protein